MPDTQIIGIDNLNDYYDIGLKESRLNDLSTYLIGFYNILLQGWGGVVVWRGRVSALPLYFFPLSLSAS